MNQSNIICKFLKEKYEAQDNTLQLQICPGKGMLKLKNDKITSLY